jgi:hypothetical protein
MTAYVIQSIQNTSTSAGTPVVLVGTLPGPVRAGNCVLVTAWTADTTSNGTITSVTLSGVSDNFGQIYSVGGPSHASYNQTIGIWADPSCAGGGSVVSVAYGGLNPSTAGSYRVGMTALEVGGLYPTLSLLYDVATWASGTSTAPFNSGTTTLTSAPAEMWLGVVAGNGANSTITPTGWPWISLAANGNAAATNSLVSYQMAPATGSPSYSGSFGAPANWTAGVIALRGIGVSAPALPGFIAGLGVQQGDMQSSCTSPAGFFQQRTIFRAEQVTTTTTLPSGTPGANTTVQYDIVHEDPYQGWSTTAYSWMAPYTGWYHVVAMVAVGTAPLDTLLVVTIVTPASTGGCTGIVVPTTGGVAQGEVYAFLTGQKDVVSVQASVVSGSNVSTQNAPGSSLQIEWVGSQL